MVQTCYEQCLRDYQAYVPCGAEWIAIYDCLVGLECARRFYATCVSILRDSTGSRNAYSRGRWRMVSWPWASTNCGLWMCLAGLRVYRKV